MTTQTITDEKLSHQVSINIPFESEKQASIACNSLSPDLILRSTELSVSCRSSDRNLICEFSGSSDRVIRVAISSVIDNLKTIIECMDEFDAKEDVIFTEA
ncbi:DEHA2E18964p [Debaryomyces hansenii CBS767]|uniref:EKC/KEOPS complex subunit PCC1 n=1 Tax=Debaryomyces hansenii (strain ATCC 36239 / CBS 767 / BCRC 21394 / JCM 1990 / NBRC 0083 / IGC 2968) TaxID=284592 RepID=PCC1_DEBHA|nr:DEHA2E18964p [Debaryomyces hansenii CBS767]Q6BNU4.2 RecName: Full=EKC/KEOPS complex subunit PCC1 [Debaryomyces hansenii CBS767]CAG88396.2 DEHA2E18964p [Debaryomyces hansenii CBS767]|eukprot:XP_460126.2 DEHA2E18964p [Debaryomyces hansenii CBS767]